MANIQKHSTAAGKYRYRVRFRTPEGQSREKWFDLKRDAEHFLTTVEHSKSVGAFADPLKGRQTFGDWWHTWRSTRVDLRPSTIARDESLYRCHVEPQFAQVQLGQVDRTMLREWVAQLNAQGLKASSVHKAVQLVGGCLDAAIDERLLVVNPARGLPLPKIQREEMQFLTPNQVATLAETINPRFRVWVFVAAYSGLRFGELAALRRNSVDLLKRRIQVSASATEVRGHIYEGPPKTRAGRRSVPIPGPIADLLAEHVHGMKPEDLVFSDITGGHLRAGSFRSRFFAPPVVELGFGSTTRGVDGKSHYKGLRIHDLRHTAVTFWLAAGASPKEVATWAGHSSVATVLDRYGHLLPGQELRVTDALEVMFEAATPAVSGDVVQLVQKNLGGLAGG